MVSGITIQTQQIVINSTALFRQPSGSVAEWCTRRGRDLEVQAKKYAPPKRSFAKHGTWATGRMQRTIHGAATQHDLHSLDIWLWCTSPHAKYVLGGTASQGRRYIYTTHGYANRSAVNSWIDEKQFTMEKGLTGFVMPVGRVPFKWKLFLRVKGQKANPFLSDAYYSVQLKHDALPKLTFKRYGFDNF